MSRLVNAFVDAYCADTLSGFTPDAASKPFDEKYVVLQPRIRVCFVDRLDSAEIYGRHIPSNLPPQLYPHPGVYSSFLSANYYKFPEQVDCGEYNYSIQLSNKGRFTPLIADTDLVNTLNAFLKDTGVSDPYQKSAFLKKMLKLYRRGLVRDITGAGVVPLYYFNYAFFIDQVIFDKTMRHALIQFSFINQSRQAYYIRISNEWIRKVNRPCLQT
ncbi:hypothetical protein [Compostibacter hankyongensis]